MTIADLNRRYLQIIQDNPRDILDVIRVSENAKTGASINLAITATCNPTKECMSYCYGNRGPIASTNSLLVQRDNVTLFNYLETASKDEVDKNALHIAKVVDKNGMNWIRWNGVGDLIPGSVRVINALAVLRPDIIQWVITRKPAMAKLLSDHKSIKILFSLDASTPENIKNRAINIKKTFKKAKFRFSWVRRDESTKIPRNVNIVFNEHIGKKHNGWEDKRVCEATLPNHNHKDSCNDCRRCFA